MKNQIILLFFIFIIKVSFAQNDSLQSNIFYKEFNYPNGNIASKGYLKDNKPINFWESYYITGIKKSEGKWNNNKLDSVWIFYDQVGDTTEKINYYLGKRNGYHYKFFKSEDKKNKVKSRELYINGKRNDKSLEFYENRTIKKITPFLEDKKQGVGFEYDKNGNIITITRYRNNKIIVQENINGFNDKGEKEGIWKEFYENGLLKEEKNYLSGKLNGYFKIYNEEGKLVNALKYKNGLVDLNSKDIDLDIDIKEKYDEQGNIVFQGSYNKEIPIGVHRCFSSTGKVTQSKTYDISGKVIAEGISLINGREEGDWIYYYANGKKLAKGKFSKGKKTGKWIYYYTNGKIQQTGSYTGGKLTGLWYWYYKNGKLLREEYYIYGQLDGEAIEYSVLETVISKGSYIEGYKEGEWIYIVGDQKHIGKYVMDLKDGEWKSYYIDEDKLSFKGRYIQGNQDGKHVYYYPNGQIKEERYYSEGLKEKAWSKYDEYGDLVLVVQYRDGKVYKINGIKVNLNNDEN